MWRSVLVVCCILAEIKGIKIKPPVSKCIKNKGPLPLAAEVAGCTNVRPPCVLTQGENTLVSIAFRAPLYSPVLSTRMTSYQKLRGVVYGLPVEMPADGWRTCNFLWHADCPVHEGQLLMYPLDWLVDEPTLMPGATAAVEIEVVDTADIVLCLRIEFMIWKGKIDPFAYVNKVQKNRLIQNIYSG